MADCIAVLNAGSSSIKFALFTNESDQRLVFRGQVENLGVAPRMTVHDADGGQVLENDWGAEQLDHRTATKIIFETAIGLLAGKPVAAVGHRVVHGGIEFTKPVRVTKDVLSRLRSLCPLAPLHQPHNLAPIEAILSVAPHVPQVACFDTAFHQSGSRLPQTFALPRELTDSGIRRYGFHGLSYEYVSTHLARVAPGEADKRIIIAHLGNGASLCAIHRRRSVATTMGFTAVEGLVMGTRCGSIDPGVLIYLMDERGLDARGLEELIYKKCGLLGVSGISSDMRTLRASEDPRARDAIDLFIYRISREIGSLSAALGGLEGLVFTGGIGQRDALTRSEVVAGCEWLGAKLNETANRCGEGRIDDEASKLPIWVLPTDEECVIARHTAELLGGVTASGASTGKIEIPRAAVEA
jgi:acetate kinase